ncbi:MAG: collagen-like protein [Ruminococcaceae bacterium]|jgi:hypothetical protein|nr:collagen-like protein [Oscillospiraceae bacterium]
MNKVQMYISLDVCRPGLQETVYVTGGDQASRELCISLNVGGVPLDMQSGEVTAAYYSMINNSPVLGECRLEGGRIIHELTATECANTHTANIRVQDADGAVLYSPQLQVVSSAPIYSDRALSQSDELSALTKALADTMKSQIAGITESVANGVHTYTVTFGDNSTRTFTVQDGAAGPQGIPGTDGKDGAPGADGAPGKNGTDGRGINTAWVNDNGELQLEYSDGEEDNLGNVKGPRGAKGVKGDTGAQGPAGADGIGITDAQITEDGELQITYTDGTTVLLGEVVGPKGDTGAAGKDGVNGSDGAKGDKGDKGDPGEPGASGVETWETVFTKTFDADTTDKQNWILSKPCRKIKLRMVSVGTTTNSSAGDQTVYLNSYTSETYIPNAFRFDVAKDKGSFVVAEVELTADMVRVMQNKSDKSSGFNPADVMEKGCIWLSNKVNFNIFKDVEAHGAIKSLGFPTNGRTIGAGTQVEILGVAK